MATKRRRPQQADESEADVLMRVLKGGLEFEVVGEFSMHFEWLLQLFPRPLAERIAATMAAHLSRRRKSTMRHTLYCLRNLVVFCAGKRGIRDKLRRESTGMSIGSPMAWSAAVLAWAANVNSRKITVQSKGRVIGSTNRIIRRLVDAGIAPPITLPAEPSRWRARVGKRHSLLDQVGGLDSVGKALEDFRANLEAKGVRLDSEEIAYLGSVAARVPGSMTSSQDAVISSIAAATKEILNLVRRVAEQRLVQILKRQKEVDAAVIQWGTSHAEKLYDKLAKVVGHGKTLERHTLLEELFPADNINVSNANWLIIIRERFDGIAPSPKTRGLPKRYGESFLPSMGGLPGVDDVTSITMSALASCCLLYLVDSLSNVCTALELRDDCLVPTDDSRIERVASVKPRAGYEPIVTDFAISEANIEVTVPQAVRFVQRQTAYIRKKFGAKDHNLFLCVRRSNDGKIAPSVLTGGTLRNWLLLMLGGERNARPTVTPSAIRVSGLMHRTLLNDGDVVATRLHAHHQPGSGVSEAYARTYPVKLLYVNKIRNFTEFLQNKIVFSHLELKQAFGLTKVQATAMLEKAERTGFGFSCKSPFSNLQQVPVREKRCDDVGAQCIGCEGSLFLVDFDNLVDLLSIRHQLLEQRETLEVQATGKWEKEYLPLLAFCEVVLEKAKRSVHAAMLHRAQSRVNELVKKGELTTIVF